MNPLYTAKVKVTGGRAGHASSSDGVLDLKLSLPKEMGGDGVGVNPEQLFAAGYAACFESALRHQAKQHGSPISRCEIDAEVALTPVEGGGFSLSVRLHLTDVEGVDQEALQKLVDLVHAKICPYSNAIRGNVPVEITLGQTVT